MAKVVLQGGFMVQAIKHGKPRSIENRIPFYITTNELSYFGNDDVNVKRRVRVFTTKSLDSCETNVDRWIKDNPVDCIVWCAEEIENVLTFRWPRGGGVDATHPTVFSNFSQKWEELLLQTKFLPVGSSLGHLPMKTFFKSDLPPWF